MTILAKAQSPKIEINLDGPDGNAYCLLSCARYLCQKYALDYDAIHAELTAGDYEDLIQTFDKHFGNYVNLYR